MPIHGFSRLCLLSISPIGLLSCPQSPNVSDSGGAPAFSSHSAHSEASRRLKFPDEAPSRQSHRAPPHFGFCLKKNRRWLFFIWYKLVVKFWWLKYTFEVHFDFFQKTELNQNLMYKTFVLYRGDGLLGMKI